MRKQLKYNLYQLAIQNFMNERYIETLKTTNVIFIPASNDLEITLAIVLVFFNINLQEEFSAEIKHQIEVFILILLINVVLYFRKKSLKFLNYENFNSLYW